MKLLWLLSLAAFCSCASKQDSYIEKNPQLSTQKIQALRTNSVVNGMTEEEVRISLGEPMFVEKKEHALRVRWIYRLSSAGQPLTDVYEPESAFPQGIAYIIPFYYRAQEIRVDFDNGTVCQVHEILNF